jgi:spore maturation protein CgeB
MRIMVLGSIGRTSVEMAGFCKNAFERLGHTVDLSVYDDRRLTARWAAIRPLEKFAFRRILVGRIRSFRPDFILTIKGDCFDAALIQHIRSASGVPIVNFWIDDPFYLHLSKKVSPLYDVFFTNAEQCQNEHALAGCKNVKFLSFGFDDALHRRMILTQDEKRKFGSDVSFTGTLSDERIEMLKGLAGLDLKIWSLPEVTHIKDFDVWSTPLPPDHPLFPHITGTPVWGDDMVRVCNASKIVLNLHMQDTPTMRDFEVTACGAFLLTNRVHGLERFFEIGSEIACFDSSNDLKEKAEHYLSRQDERDKIAKRGHERTMRHHRYRDRMKIVIDEVEKVVSGLNQVSL